MAKGRNTFEKHRRELEKKRKAEEKRKKRRQKKEHADPPEAGETDTTNSSTDLGSRDGSS
jgi:hypothetical protein